MVAIMKALAGVLCFAAALTAASAANESVVAADGSGQYRTIQAAVDAAPANSRTRFTIRIKPGRYAEGVMVPSEKPFLALVGTDAAATVITAAGHAGLPGADGKPINTFATPTVFIQANDFLAENLTFEDSAGPHGQAVALTIMGDRGVFRNCRFLGYQDTLLPQAGRQYFEHCYIAGATDFIFGGSAAWFEDCDIHVTANGHITAANTTRDQQHGYVFHKCRITGEPNVRTFLGRPWRPWAATVWLETAMSDAVRPQGWNNWNDPAREKTVRYAEYGSTGPGAAPASRVSWARALTEAEARRYTIESVLGGLDGWNPKTGKVRQAIRVARAAHAAPGAPSTPLPAADARVAVGPDGVHYAVWAGSVPGDKSFRHAASKDGASWSEPERIEIPVENALDFESPNLFYDAASAQFIVTFSCTLARNAIQAFQEDTEHNPRVWYSTTKDFATFSPPKLLFDNNYAARDAQILKAGSRYGLLHTDITWPVHALRIAWSDSPYGPWGPSTDAFTNKGTDTPSATLTAGVWSIRFLDAQTRVPHLYQTRDFWSFTDLGALPAPPGGRLTPKPLYRDPVHDGAADPVLVFNRAQKQWWIFYTNRRANVSNLRGVAWVHGTRIGIAASGDGGAHWRYLGTAMIPYGTPDYTHWAPEIIDHDGVYHMYLSIVPGIFENWDAAREIIHLTSRDLKAWTFEARLDLGSDRVIDPSLARLPDGTWRMWYKNERTRDGSLYYADSPDLFHWTSKGYAIRGVSGEGPKVFSWKGSYWLIADVWDGLAVFRSSDCLNWTRQAGNLLKEPGTVETDRAKGSHADVVVSGGRAWLFYFVHQSGDQEQRKHTVLQVVELQDHDGVLTADRNAPTRIDLK